MRAELESRALLHVRGTGEPPREVVDPAVIRARERAGIPCPLRDFDATMDAHVGERVERAILIAHDHHRLARDAQRHVVARIRQLLGTSDVEPVAQEQPLHLALVHLRRRVEKSWRVAGIGERALHRVKRVETSCTRDVAVDHSILRVRDDIVSAVTRDAGCGISASSP